MQLCNEVVVYMITDSDSSEDPAEYSAPFVCDDLCIGTAWCCITIVTDSSSGHPLRDIVSSWIRKYKKPQNTWPLRARTCYFRMKVTSSLGERFCIRSNWSSRDFTIPSLVSLGLLIRSPSRSLIKSHFSLLFKHNQSHIPQSILYPSNMSSVTLRIMSLWVILFSISAMGKHIILSSISYKNWLCR